MRTALFTCSGCGKDFRASINNESMYCKDCVAETTVPRFSDDEPLGCDIVGHDWQTVYIKGHRCDQCSVCGTIDC